MPSKEELRAQIKVGFEYISCEDWSEEEKIAHMTAHLWGTVGMWLKGVKKEEDKKEDIYNKWPARVNGDEREGETPIEQLDADAEGPMLEKEGLHL